MTQPPDFAPGDELTSGSLNQLGAAIVARSPSLSPGSGLAGWSLPSGVGYRAIRPAEGWFKVTGPGSGAGSGSYFALTEQVELESGGFADGPWQVNAAAYPPTASPPVGAIVRAWRDRARWGFLFGSCPS